jgi:hypothetical protein
MRAYGQIFKVNMHLVAVSRLYNPDDLCATCRTRKASKSVSEIDIHLTSFTLKFWVFSISYGISDADPAWSANIERWVKAAVFCALPAPASSKAIAPRPLNW